MARLFIILFKNLDRSLLPESGESLIQVRVWKTHLKYCLLFREIGASPLLLCVDFLWKSARHFQTVKGFKDIVTLAENVLSFCTSTKQQLSIYHGFYLNM